MNNQEQDIAVAKALGWKIGNPENSRADYRWWLPPNKKLEPNVMYGDKPPSFGSDLNACHEMETWLWAQAENGEFSTYSRILEDIVISAWNLDHDTIRSAISAKPFQRREAFLRALGQWTS